MTDQTIPAGLTRDEAQAVREWAERARDAQVQDGTVAHAARVLLAVLPKRPTLADMTPEERSASRWMQCDHGIPGRYRGRGVIGYFDYGDEKAVILTATCGVQRRDYAHVTPRPDLPRLTWPGDKKPAPAPSLPGGWRLANHPGGSMTPQIIRTREELDALEPDTLLVTHGLVATLPLEILWHLDSPPESVLSHDDVLPAVVVATGDQVRAARQALEAADAVD